MILVALSDIKGMYVLSNHLFRFSEFLTQPHLTLSPRNSCHGYVRLQVWLGIGGFVQGGEYKGTALQRP